MFCAAAARVAMILAAPSAVGRAIAGFILLRLTIVERELSLISQVVRQKPEKSEETNDKQGWQPHIESESVSPLGIS
jgi:hypothetical protein